MYVAPLVRREFALLARSKWLWLLTIPIFWVGRNFLTIPIAEGPLLTIGTASNATTLVSFAAIIVCFRSIIGERESGTIRVTAGTPLSRTDVLVGKALGRGLALALPLGGAVLCLTALGWAQYGPPPLIPYLGFLILALGFCIIYSNLITAISATASSTVRSAVLSITAIWLLGNGTNYVLSIYSFFTRQSITISNPPNDPLLFLAVRAFPRSSYRTLVNTLLDLPNTHQFFVDALQITASSDTGFAVNHVFGPNPPVYLSPWIAALTFLMWLIGPLSLAAIRFQSIDLTRPVSTLSTKFVGVFPIQLRQLWIHIFSGPFSVFSVLVSDRDRLRVSAWMPVARREFTHKSQSIGTPLLFVLVILGVLWQLTGAIPLASETLGADITLAAFQIPVALFGILGPVFFGFRTIVNERESGAIRYTTGTPISRTGVILGKTVALIFAVTTPLVYGLLIGSSLGILWHGLFSPFVFIGMLAVSILYVSFHAVLIVSISAIASTTTRSAALGFGYVLIAGLWQVIQRSIYSFVANPSYSLYRPPPDTVYFLTRRLFPRHLFNVISNWVLGIGNSSATYATALQIQQAAGEPNNAFISPTLVVDTAYSNQTVPLVLEPWVAGVFLILGLVGVLAMTVYHFQTTDLT
ncbi:ABC transporter permease [Halorubrum sp. Atlit-26R]|uniref:ABC transporter permease n=1 Tax=Halorubrum sp. Atlit-26R TaxID=2282128 RepID=UPI000EF1BA02|nr:ABC transporter permease subunit [Halorubrum sp. Atlit-26R]RLM68628.1 hypothetical protein DVK07_10960 [Halorubrum sp. Atlit-26R]